MLHVVLYVVIFVCMYSPVACSPLVLCCTGCLFTGFLFTGCLIWSADSQIQRFRVQTVQFQDRVMYVVRCFSYHFYVSRGPLYSRISFVDR